MISRLFDGQFRRKGEHLRTIAGDRLYRDAAAYLAHLKAFDEALAAGREDEAKQLSHGPLRQLHNSLTRAVRLYAVAREIQGWR